VVARIIMKYLFLIEIPSLVSNKQRILIKNELKSLACQTPKRNCFVLEIADKRKAEKIKE
jgi:hypothetical protein